MSLSGVWLNHIIIFTHGYVITKVDLTVVFVPMSICFANSSYCAENGRTMCNDEGTRCIPNNWWCDKYFIMKPL